MSRINKKPIRFVDNSSDDEIISFLSTKKEQNNNSKSSFFYSKNKKENSIKSISKKKKEIDISDSLFEIESPKKIDILNKSRISIIDEDLSTNYSTILEEDHLNDEETTNDSVLMETQKQLVQELKKINDDKKKTRDDLLLELKKLKIENNNKLDSKKEGIDKIAITLEKNIGSLRTQLYNVKKNLEEVENEQKKNENFNKLSKLSEDISILNDNFKSSSDIIKSLSNILSFSPLTESDFILLNKTSNFKGEIGEKIKNLIETTKKILIEK